MKTKLFIAAMLFSAATAMAKDIKTAVFTTQPQMHCENCENKIKNNLRFEKGIKKIETNVEKQAVTVTYDADKTTPEAIIAGFKKIGYEAAAKKSCAGKTCCAEKQTCAGAGHACAKNSQTCMKSSHTCAKDAHKCAKSSQTCEGAAKKECKQEGCSSKK